MIYRYETNKHIDDLLRTIQEKYPYMTITDIMSYGIEEVYNKILFPINRKK